MRKSIILVSVGVAALLAACGGDDGEKLLEVDSATVTADLQRQLDGHIMGAASAGAFVESSDLLIEVVPEDEAPTPTPVPSPSPFPGGSGGGSITDEARDMADFLKQHIFVASNVESSDATSVTYLVAPAGICEEGDADCISMLTDIPLRFVVTSPAEGAYDAKLLVGTDRLNPADFEISDAQLAAEIDLADLKAVVELFAAREGEDAELPEVMSGRLRAELVRNAQGDYTALFGVLEAINLEYAGMAANFGVAEQALTLHFVGADELFEVEADLGDFSLSIPAELMQSEDEICEYDSEGIETCWFETSGPTSGVFTFNAPGFSGSAAFNGLTEVLSLTDLSFGEGPSKLAVDGQDLLVVEVNKDTGHSFSATLSLVEGNLQIAVQPSFELVARMTLQNLLAHVSDDTEIEPWMLDETLTVALRDNGVVEMLGEAIKVVSGTLELSSKDYSVTVGAGQCAIEAEGEATHPMANMSAGECPVSQSPDPLP